MTDLWTETTLGEVIELHDHKRIPLSTQERSQRQGLYPYYGAAGIIDSVDDYIFDGRYLLMAEDGSVVTTDGKPVLQLVKGKFWVSNHAHVVQAKSPISTHFLYFTLSNVVISGYITGTAQPKLSQRNLKAIRLSLPPLPIQRKIASILSAYDDLIENNTHRIKILEDIAATIYRQWFVEFRFPGHENVPMVESELGSIPQRWEVGALGDIIENIREKVKPGRHLEPLAYVPIDCIPRHSIALIIHKPSSEAKSSLIAFKRNDILFGAMRSYFHKVIFAPFDGITRQTCFVLRPKNLDNYPFDLFTTFQDSTVEYSSNHSTGSTIPYATWDGVLARMPIVRPPNLLMQQFSNIVNPMLDSIRGLTMKNTNSSHQYDENYRERHGQLKVFCVGMREPMLLDDVYVSVQFLDQDKREKYSTVENLERIFRHRHLELSLDEELLSPDEERTKRQDGTKVANEKQYLMVLGGPGVGKSTFLRKVGLEALKKNEYFEHKCIPVFLELKRFFKDQIDIEELISKEFEICGYPYPDEMVKTALESGKLLILFDGLDEVPTANIDNVIGTIGDFVDRYSKNRFIASCRIAAYKGGFTRFTEVELAYFDDSQIEAYINNWFASTSDLYRRQLDEGMKTAEQCWNTLNQEEHEATKELARNPLLLTLLCMVYDSSQNFPRNRANLYEDALSIFLKEWAAEKRVRRDATIGHYLDISVEKRMLSEIAAKNFEKDHVFFSEQELLGQIIEFGEGSADTSQMFDAPKILETIIVEQGLFVERVSHFYSFSHLTFQEYLTANYIVGDPQSIMRLVTKYMHGNRWREVFLLTAGLMREADNLLMEMTRQASKRINTERLKSLLQWARFITNTPDSPYSGIAKRAFAIRQFISLWLLNKISSDIKHIISRYPDLNPNLGPNRERDVRLCMHVNCGRSLYQDLYEDLYQAQNLKVKLDRNLDFDGDYNLYTELYTGLDLSLKLFINAFRHIYEADHPELFPDLNFYQNLCRYITINYYPPAFSRIVNKYNRELGERITIVERMEQARIFKKVDLQRLVQEFNEERKFINAAREGKAIKPPEGSIHDTWISILHISDEMLSISHEEMEDYIQYLRGVELIVACKEAAGRVTPKVWKQVENRLLTWNTEDIEG